MNGVNGPVIYVGMALCARVSIAVYNTCHLSMYHGDLGLHVEHLLLKLLILSLFTRQPLLVQLAADNYEEHNGCQDKHHKNG